VGGRLRISWRAGQCCCQQLRHRCWAEVSQLRLVAAAGTACALLLQQQNQQTNNSIDSSIA
jgi:hypothetical protein